MSTIDSYTIHFAHTADWHLGRRPYHNEKLYEDFFVSASRCIDNIIVNNPDFILHCGDMFNEANPNSGIRMEAHKLLNRLKSADIPVYIIRGNHDASPAYSERSYGTILDELHNLGFIHYIRDDVININDRVSIYGIGEYGKGFGAKLSDLLDEHPLDKSKINILAVHAYVTGQLPGGKADVSSYQLSDAGFDYIALGHFHNPWQNAKERLFCPGSIEHQSVSEWRSPDKDGFCTNREYLDVKLGKDQIEVEKIIHRVRPKAKIVVSLTSDMAFNARDQIVKTIQEYDKRGGLLHLTVEGDLKSGELTKIDFRELEHSSNHLLLCKIIPDISEPRVHYKPGITEEEAIYQLLLEKYNFSEEEATKFRPVVRNIISILSRKKSATDDMENEAIKLLNAYIDLASEEEE